MSAEPTRAALRAAWIAWVPAALFFLYGFFNRTAPAVMADDLMHSFAVGGALLGNLAAFYFYAYAAIQVGVGVLVDNFGPRRIFTMAALLTGAGAVVFGGAETLHEAYLGRLLVGIGAGFSWVSCLALISERFPPQRFAFTAGLTTLVGMIGAAGGQAPLAIAVEAYGWRAPMIATGIAGIGLALLCWILIKDHARPAPTDDAPAKHFLHSLGVAARNRQTWIIALFTGAQISPFLGLTSLWVVPYLMQVHGMERATAASLAMAMIAGLATGGPSLGWLSDKIGRRKPAMFLALAGQSVGIALAFYVPHGSIALQVVGLAIAGFFASGIIIGFATAREANGGEGTGAAAGIVNTAVIGGGALIQPAIGALLDGAWDGAYVAGARLYSAAAYEGAFLSLYVALALGLLAAIFVRETYCGHRSMPKAHG
jgi:MFS family permease